MTGDNVYAASPLSVQSSTSSLVDSANPGAASTSTADADILVEVPLVQDFEVKRAQSAAVPSNPPAVKRPTPTRDVPRLNTRVGSLAGPLPWKVDETGSPYTPTSQRKASFAPPPRSSCRENVDTSGRSNTSASPSHCNSYQPSTPYASNSPTTSIGGPVIDLSHPPGYTQDARASFSDRTDTLTSSPYSNAIPFYQSNFSSCISSPITPTRRRRGILDNEPSIYLRGEGDGEESMWDTATKWAKAAGMRLSQGEQQIWKIVNAVSNGEDDRLLERP